MRAFFPISNRTIGHVQTVLLIFSEQPALLDNAEHIVAAMQLNGLDITSWSGVFWRNISKIAFALRPFFLIADSCHHLIGLTDWSVNLLSTWKLFPANKLCLMCRMNAVIEAVPNFV